MSMAGGARETLAMKMRDKARWARIADGLAVALVISLPWSTSATNVLAVLWLIALIPTIDPAALRRVMSTPAGGLPLLLVALAAVGMVWAFNVPMEERIDGLKGFYKLLAIPLLMLQFQRSERGAWMIYGFIASCSALLLVSTAHLLFGIRIPGLRGNGGPGVPVKDYIAQSGEFTVCIFVLAAVALNAWRAQRRWVALGLMLLAVAFLINMVNVVISRTALVVFPVLLLAFAFKNLPWKAAAAALAGLLVLGAAICSTTPSIRLSVTGLSNEIREFSPQGASTRAGERLVFWAKSISFVADAPLLGHGTGSIRDQFRRAAAGQTGMAAMASSNPHNQTLAVAIQLGLLGTIVLFGLWMSHLLLFRCEGIAAWAGLVVVTQNIVSSLFNSHLFDFTQGWGYVIGVGVAGGMMLKRSLAAGPVPVSAVPPRA